MHFITIFANTGRLIISKVMSAYADTSIFSFIVVPQGALYKLGYNCDVQCRCRHIKTLLYWCLY